MGNRPYTLPNVLPASCAENAVQKPEKGGGSAAFDLSMRDGSLLIAIDGGPISTVKTPLTKSSLTATIAQPTTCRFLATEESRKLLVEIEREGIQIRTLPRLQAVYYALGIAEESCLVVSVGMDRTVCGLVTDGKVVKQIEDGEEFSLKGLCRSWIKSQAKWVEAKSRNDSKFEDEVLNALLENSNGRDQVVGGVQFKKPAYFDKSIEPFKNFLRKLDPNGEVTTLILTDWGATYNNLRELFSKTYKVLGPVPGDAFDQALKGLLVWDRQTQTREEQNEATVKSSGATESVRSKGQAARLIPTNSDPTRERSQPQRPTVDPSKAARVPLSPPVEVRAREVGPQPSTTKKTIAAESSTTPKLTPVGRKDFVEDTPAIGQGDKVQTRRSQATSANPEPTVIKGKPDLLPTGQTPILTSPKPPAAPRQVTPNTELVRLTRKILRSMAIGVSVAFIVIIIGVIAVTSSWQRSPTPVPTPVPPVPTPIAPAPTPVPIEQFSDPSMVLIKGGTFMMGRNSDDSFERPSHLVTVDSFYLDATEVTRNAYKTCVDKKICERPSDWVDGAYPPNTGDWPVTNISWDAARTYANSVGKRLPTEEEWEFAARGSDGRLYPWGHIWQEGYANIGSKQLTRVRSFRATPSGLFDMTGNAQEWTASELRRYPDKSEYIQTQYPPERLRVVRGGSYANSKARVTTTYRNALRINEEEHYAQTGFRCARSYTP
jgi:formylglycine-generating enzyme required for sulfatase activity